VNKYYNHTLNRHRPTSNCSSATNFLWLCPTDNGHSSHIPLYSVVRTPNPLVLSWLCTPNSSSLISIVLRCIPIHFVLPNSTAPSDFSVSLTNVRHGLRRKHRSYYCSVFSVGCLGTSTARTKENVASPIVAYSLPRDVFTGPSPSNGCFVVGCTLIIGQRVNVAP
jgi:hypothetical protein